jgi:hypothetical protein
MQFHVNFVSPLQRIESSMDLKAHAIWKGLLTFPTEHRLLLGHEGSEQELTLYDHLI